MFDIYFEQDITHLWTKQLNGSLKHYKLTYHPTIYIVKDSAADQHPNCGYNRTLEQIDREIQAHRFIVETRAVMRYLTSNDEKPLPVLKVAVLSPTRIKDVIADLTDKQLNLFNIDINPRQQFFLDTKSYPFGACHIHVAKNRTNDRPSDLHDLISIEMFDVPDKINYPIPILNILKIQVDINSSTPFPTFKDQIQQIDLQYSQYNGNRSGEIILQGLEKEILIEFVHHINLLDPDFVQIENGDKFMLNYLAHRASYHSITDDFILGRLNIPLYPRNRREGQSYMTYGQIVRREPVWYLPGRIHLDAENSFFMYESGIAGLIDLSRMGGVPPERTSRASIGTVLTGIEFHINAATIPETLVPPNKAEGEEFKAAEGLLIADNGGLIYPASPGVYDRVWAIDYTSLYPMIMGNHNIGNETVLCSHKACESSNFVPEIGYHVCQRKVGVVPYTMHMVLQKRLMLKMTKRKQLSSTTLERYKGIDSAMKWILVSCFGYLGFKNSRWGSIESHQCVTAYARRYLLQARQICEEKGFEVVAGITDSLFVRAKDHQDSTRNNVEQLVYEITKATSIPLDIEGKFNWVVFCNVRDYTNVSALNRYFGFFEKGEFKLRGIKHRQRRASKSEKKFQEEILELLSQAQNVSEFKKLIPEANKILLKWKAKLKGGLIDPRDLVIKLKSTKGAEGYKTTSTVQALTVKKYQLQGLDIKAGQNFFFLVRDDTLKTVDRVTIGPNVSKNSKYDVDFYSKLLEDDFLELLEAPQHMFFGEVMYDGNDAGPQQKLEIFMSAIVK